MVLVKAVLEVLPVYWMSLSWIQKGILEVIRRLCCRFIWSECKDRKGMPLVNWKRIAVPKAQGGWGVDNIFLFCKALAAKNAWRLLQSTGSWAQVIKEKYIAPEGMDGL